MVNHSARLDEDRVSQRIEAAAALNKSLKIAFCELKIDLT